MSNPRSRIEFKPEFQQSLNDINNGTRSRESILKETDCNRAVRDAIAYNFLTFGAEPAKQPIDLQELRACSFTLNNSGH